MAKKNIESLGNLLKGVKADRVGVVNLDDWKVTPLRDDARRLLRGRN